jgi:hypothetical protein
MAWVSSYFDVALFVALLCFVLVESTVPASPQAGSPIVTVALAGLLWPLLIIGAGLLLSIIGATTVCTRILPRATRRNHRPSDHRRR